jgi:peptide/nickel transport system substrate-binding protein
MRTTGGRTAAVLATGVLAGAVLASAGGCWATPVNQQPRSGGTLHILRTAPQFGHLDPQLDVVSEDAALAGAYLQRTLTAYQPDPDGGRLVADLATDTGRPSPDARTWSFTLRTGATFADGAPIACADVKYGVSRAFATEQLPGARATGIGLLDVPRDATGAATYHGPYPEPGNDVAGFDRAVECSPDGRTVTFHLVRPAGDFNGAVTQLAFSPVPRSADTGAGYDQNPVSSGPYRIAENTPGVRLVLLRNDRWSRAADPYRPAYPDRIVVEFGLTGPAIRARLAASSAADQAVVTADPQPGPSATAGPAAGTAIDGYQPWVRYLAIDTKKVPVLAHRQAILAALDRAAINRALDGLSPGSLADGLISPGLGAAYAPTHLWDSLLGGPVGEHGDAGYARGLIDRSGQPMPALTFAYDQSPTNDAVAAEVVGSLRRAGIAVTARAVPRQQYYRLVADPATGAELMLSSWGADWPNGSTVIPALLTASGSHNLSRYDDPAFTAAAVANAARTDPTAQARGWARLNAQAMAQAVVAPLRFDRDRRLVGSAVGGAFLWSACGTLPYPLLWVRSAG